MFDLQACAKKSECTNVSIYKLCTRAQNVDDMRPPLHTLARHYPAPPPRAFLEGPLKETEGDR